MSQKVINIDTKDSIVTPHITDQEMKAAACFAQTANSPCYKADEAVRNIAAEKADVLNILNIKYICDWGLSYTGAHCVKADKLESVGSKFLVWNMPEEVVSIDFPNLQRAGDDFCLLSSIESANLPSLKYAGKRFISNSGKMTSLDLPVICELESGFIERGYNLKKFSAPQVMQIHNDVLTLNTELQELNFPCLIKIGNNFLRNNKKLKVFNAPWLISAGENCHPLVYDAIRANQSKIADFLIRTKASKSFGI